MPTGSVRAGYDAAKRKLSHERHMLAVDGLGPNASLSPEVRARIRNWARYEAANDPYCSGILKTLVNDTIATGPALNLINIEGKTAKDIERIWWEWSLAIRLAQKLQTMRRAKAVDGEAFASIVFNPRVQHRCKVDIRLHEAEMIAAPWNDAENAWLDGIILDDFENVVGYMVWPVHPGERSPIGANPETVRVEQMIHLFEQLRPGQLRGVSELSSVLSAMAYRRRYAEAVVNSAEQAALHTIVVQSKGIGTFGVSEVPETEEIERGMKNYLPDGWEMSQLKPEQPTDTYDGFTKAQVREIARPFNMPLNVAAGDSSGYNYASGRLDHQVYYKSIDCERFLIQQQALLKIWPFFWDEFRGNYQEIIPVELLEMEASDVEHTYRWDGREHVDPLKEASAQRVRLQNGTTHRGIEFMRAGLDMDEEDRIAAQSYGVTVEEYRRALFERNVVLPSRRRSVMEDEADNDDETE